MAKHSSSEKRKKLLAAALGGLLVVVIVYQLMFGGGKPAKKSQNSNSATSTASTSTGSTSPASQQKPTPSPKSSDEQDQLLGKLLTDMEPLDLRALGRKSKPVEKSNNNAAAPSGKPEKPFADKGNRGNIFAEWVAPKKEVPPTPPPPIVLGGPEPSAVVAGTPRSFTLVLRGSKIPVDAQIYFDGRVKPTTRASDREVSTKIDASDYAYPRTITIEVKSQSDPAHNNSNPVLFVVQAVQEPQFRYLGYVGGQASLESYADKKVRLYSRGSEIDGWRIDSISDKAIEVTHKQYEIKRRLSLAPKTP